jgi:hypothetical protein
MFSAKSAAWAAAALTLLTVTGVARAAEEAGTQRRLYATVPDGAMNSPGKPGIYVYDIDSGHQLVKHMARHG